MRLVFLYVMHTRGKFYARRIVEEGYYYLLTQLVKYKIVDEVLIVVHGTGEVTPVSYPFPGVSGIIVPDLQALALRDNDIIWCRGGFRAWHDVLKAWGEKGHWLINYAANTGRERWMFWDVIFNDLVRESYLDSRGRYNLAWTKPTNPEVFFPIEGCSIEYAVCIGSSFIHDKKGQWKVIDALVQYDMKYGIKLKCIMPGSFRHGVKTNKIMRLVEHQKLDVAITGMVDRSALNAIYNKTSLYVHLGGGGQNDRGPIEALSCGCNVLLETPKRHGPFLLEAPQIVKIAKDASDPVAIAEDIHDILVSTGVAPRTCAKVFFEKHCNVISQILPQMEKLFNVIRANSKPAPEALKEEFRDKPE